MIHENQPEDTPARPLAKKEARKQGETPTTDTARTFYGFALCTEHVLPQSRESKDWHADELKRTHLIRDEGLPRGLDIFAH